jgi:hypothetical protein
MGEDVMDMKIEKVKHAYSVPGKNTVFGNLFDVKRSVKYYASNLTTTETHMRMAPSQCLIYIRKYSIIKFNPIVINVRFE